MHFAANIGHAHWVSPNGRSVGQFRPNGKAVLVGVGAEPNPGWSSTKPIYAARLFVGFSVGQKPRWKLDDLIRIVTKLRKQQDKQLDSSFLAQKGIYTSRISGDVVVEDGAQVLLLNLDGSKLADFEADMTSLAEGVAKAMKQEEVIVEIQKGGITKKTMGVTPP